MKHPTDLDYVGYCMLFGIVLMWLLGFADARIANSETVPDYRNGKPNALVCPNDGECFQCDHKTAKRYRWLYAHTAWDGYVVFLPLNKKP